MELHQLRYFVQVAKLESVSQAAETLHVSQPALSRSISKLEEELGATLFDRVGRRLLLNDRGRMYLRSVEGLLRGLSEANATIGGVQADVEGSVNVGVFGSQSQAIECVAGFMSANPRVFVSFDARQQSMTSQVTREFDMVYYPAGPGFESIGGIAYATNHLMVCVNDMHPLAQAGSVDLVQFKDDPFIFMNTTAGVYEHSFKLCLQAGFSPRVRGVTSSGAAQMRFIQAGAGVGLVDTMRVGNFHRGGVRLLELRTPSQDQPQCFACRPPEMLSPAGKLLLRHTLDFFGIPIERAGETFADN